METKKIISLTFGILMLFLTLWFAWYFTSPIFSNGITTMRDYAYMARDYNEWSSFFGILISSISSILGFELMRIGLKK